MRVMGHCRPPAVQDGGETDARAEMTGVGGDGEHGLGGHPEQQVVNCRLVMESDVGDLGGYGEDHVEVADRQQVCLACNEPFTRRCPLTLGTMAVAATNGRCPLRALWANFVMGSRRPVVS